MANTSPGTFKATVDDRAMALHWYREVCCYPIAGPTGLSYIRRRHHSGADVDCLFSRDDAGRLRGILYHYRSDIPPFERRGNVNMWVAPSWHRRGVGRELLAEADRRWRINFAQQTYTNAGLALVRTHLDGAPGAI